MLSLAARIAVNKQYPRRPYNLVKDQAIDFKKETLLFALLTCF
jgi:hypothetical protein